MLEFTAPHSKCTAFKYNNVSIGFGTLPKLASIHADSEEKAALNGTDSNSLTALVFACELVGSSSQSVSLKSNQPILLRQYTPEYTKQLFFLLNLPRAI